MLLGAVSSEKLFPTKKGRQCAGRSLISRPGLLPVLRYTVALWRPGGNWIWWTARMCLPASVLLENCYLWSLIAEITGAGKSRLKGFPPFCSPQVSESGYRRNVPHLGMWCVPVFRAVGLPAQIHGCPARLLWEGCKRSARKQVHGRTKP